MHDSFSSEAMHGIDPTRATLLMRIRENGPDREVAWRDFFAIYSPIVRGYARRMGATPELADDVVQEVVRRFFQTSPKFVYNPSIGRFRGHLKTCTNRVLVGLRNATTNETHLSIDVEEPTVVRDTWEEEWQKRQFSLALDRVRKQYTRRKDSEKTFRAFEQCSIFQRSVSDIAQELGISVDSVYAANSRILKALRAAIDELSDILD